LRSIFDYESIIGKRGVQEILSMAEGVKGLKVLHISPGLKPFWPLKALNSLMSLFKSVGVDVKWKIVTDLDYLCGIDCLNGNIELEDHDVVVIYDVDLMPLVLVKSNGKRWIWRCYMELPSIDHTNYLLRFANYYDALILPYIDQELLTNIKIPNICVIPPSIDPLSERNRPLGENDILKVLERYEIDPDKPIISQVVRTHLDLKLIVKALKTIEDRIKAQVVVIKAMSGMDERLLDMDLKPMRLICEPLSDYEFNVIQRASTIALHFSMSNSFDITALEAMWKGVPVIISAMSSTAAIIMDGITGLIASTILEAYEKAILLLKKRWLAREVGENGREYVKRNFLITRDLRDCLKLYLKLTSSS